MIKRILLALSILTISYSPSTALENNIADLKSWHVDKGKPTHRFYIESPGEFRLGFVRAMNYGLSEWYDLNFDPEAKSNLTRRDLGDNPNGFQGALFNQVINPHDVIAHIGLAGTRFKDEPKTLEILEDNPRRVIVEASYYTMLSSTVTKEFKLITRYAIYPTGRIYIRNTMLFEKDYTLTTWRHATISLGDPQHYAYGTKEEGKVELIDEKTLRNPGAKWKPGALKKMVVQQPKWNVWQIADNTETDLIIGKQISGNGKIHTGVYQIGSDETTYGWLRGNDNTNPHSWSSKQSKFIFNYWDKTTPEPFAEYACASLLLAPSPDNPIQGSSALHSWLGFKRHYYGGDFKISRKKGDQIVQHYFIQLGAENSILLPDIRTAETGAVFADSYLNPVNGHKFDLAKGSYILDTELPVSITVNGQHPSPVIESSKSIQKISANGRAMQAGTDYKHQESGGAFLLQFIRGWENNDIIDFE